MDIEILIGKDLPGNMPLRYKNIMALMDILYKSKWITDSDLNSFKERCDIFFSKYNAEMLHGNNILFNLFLETTGYNDLSQRLISKNNNKIIYTDKTKTNLLYFHTKKKKHKDGLRIIEDMLFNSNITIEDFIKKAYAIYAAEPYIKNIVRIFDANYKCIAEISEQGIINYKIDSNTYLNDFITNLKLNESKIDINYVTNASKNIKERHNIVDILDWVRPDTSQFIILSRDFFDLELIERERIDTYLYLYKTV